MNLNKVLIAGNLTRDPEITFTPNNVAICKFAMAINSKRKTADGSYKEDVCFVECVAFGRTGDAIGQYMSRGRPMFIEGRLNLEQWTTQDGQKRSKMTVVVDNFQFVGDRGDKGGGQRERTPPARVAPPEIPAWKQDDIPF